MRKYGLIMLGIVLFWLLSIGWAWLVKGEVSIENVESSALAFLVGIVIAMIVNSVVEEK